MFPEESIASPTDCPQVSAGIMTVQEAAFCPSAAVAEIVVVPTPTPVTSPLVETVATAVLLLAHVTLWLVAFDGLIVADSW
jgi:hypothetical protein